MNVDLSEVKIMKFARSNYYSSIRRRRIAIVSMVTLLFVLYYFGLYLILPDPLSVNRYESASIIPGHEIVPPFSFPVPHVTKPTSEIVRMKWMRDLVDNLAYRESNLVYLSVVNQKFYETFLNWLVAVDRNTKIDLEDLLVLALDEHVHSALRLRAIPTVLVKPEWIIRHYTLVKLLKWSSSWDVQVTRETVLRLLNHWGHSVAVIDIDAVPLRDIQDLIDKYPQSDIIGSFGLKTVRSPGGNEWWMCIGAAILKSTTPMESLWELTSNTTNNFWDDETKMNYAIQSLKPRWLAEGDCDPPSLHCDMTGTTSTGLTVTLLSHDLICRHCDPLKKDGYYIWHKYGRRSRKEKKVAAEIGNVWYLRSDWRQLDKTSTSIKHTWIKELRKF